MFSALRFYFNEIFLAQAFLIPTTFYSIFCILRFDGNLVDKKVFVIVQFVHIPFFFKILGLLCFANHWGYCLLLIIGAIVCCIMI